jgi:hypothetical protein
VLVQIGKDKKKPFSYQMVGNDKNYKPEAKHMGPHYQEGNARSQNHKTNLLHNEGHHQQLTLSI